ncbi:MAG: glycosyltransferase family 4 protein [Candidatus Omnitrophota bacterium]
MKTRIVYIVDNLKTGGAQTQLSRLVEGLSGKDFEISVICLGDSNPKLVDQIGKSRVTFFPMKCIWTIGFWMNFNRMVRLLKKLKPDVVHAYLNTSNVFGAWAAKKTNVPYIVTSRRDMGHFRSGRIAAMEKWSNRFCHKVVCVSTAVKDKTIKEEHLPEEKAVVLYGGVDTELFKKQPSEDNAAPLTVGMVATMDRPMKGHFDFLKAAKILADRGKKVRFVLVGDGGLRPGLEEFVRTAKIEKVVQFKGPSNNVQQELGEMDIFVLPSHSEGFSNAVLEAMSMEVPVLANALEGNLEIIDDRSSGMLVDPRDVRQMADRIAEYVDRRSELKLMGQKARKKILENFTIGHMVNRYETFYRQLVAVKG